MTTEQLSKLTPEEKRIRIAKACDLKPFHGVVNRVMGMHAKDAGGVSARLPNYVTDLNAIHGAIMHQPEKFRKAIRFTLYALTDQMSAHFADAPTMAEAFLLTLP